MRERSPAARADAGSGLTPNQIEKRRQIVEATREVLATRGLSGCTVREIAAVGPLTKSAIHYYFADMDVLIDEAMAGHVAGFEARLRAAGDGAGADARPDKRFWVTVDAYLVLFRDRPNVAHLWFEYWIDSARKGRTQAIGQMHDRVAGLFADPLRAAGAASPEDRGRAVLVYLTGAIVDQAVEPRPDERIHADIAALTGIPPARGQDAPGRPA